MRMLSWNSQGLGSSLTGKALWKLCQIQKPEILFLIETCQKEDTIKDWERQLKFSDHHVVNPLRTGGGLAPFWGDSVQVTIIESTPNYIDTTVYFLSDAFVCKIT